ncbi:hypothetical protein GQ600_16927 [Phytophthora cactorum]|nr:hypothetical protein GQ600_16927 [Phytophthora cactorum]
MLSWVQHILGFHDDAHTVDLVVVVLLLALLVVSFVLLFLGLLRILVLALLVIALVLVVVRLGALRRRRRRARLSLLRVSWFELPRSDVEATGLLVALRGRTAGRRLVEVEEPLPVVVVEFDEVPVDCETSPLITDTAVGTVRRPASRLAVGVALRPLADLDLVTAGLDPECCSAWPRRPVLVDRHDGVARVHDVHVRNGHLLRLVAARAARPVELADVLAVEAVDVDGAVAVVLDHLSSAERAPPPPMTLDTLEAVPPLMLRASSHTSSHHTFSMVQSWLSQWTPSIWFLPIMTFLRVPPASTLNTAVSDPLSVWPSHETSERSNVCILPSNTSPALTIWAVAYCTVPVLVGHVPSGTEAAVATAMRRAVGVAKEAKDLTIVSCGSVRVVAVGTWLVVLGQLN